MPILVDEEYRVIDGFTRTRIAADLGLTEIPVEVRKGLTRDQKVAEAIRLNYQRRHMKPDELAGAIEWEEGRSDTTQQEIADKVGVSKATVSRTLTKAGRNPREEKKEKVRERVREVKERRPEATTREVAEEVGVSRRTVERVAHETPATKVSRETNVVPGPAPAPPLQEDTATGMPCYICGKSILIHDMDEYLRPVKGRRDEAEKYWQFGQGWILQQGWPNASNHIKGIRWADRFIHDACLSTALVEMSQEKEKNQ